ncbi:BrnT family toxin [Bradyrhizobium sp.]|uniref:BrnT family toxin n=1 Tax=Bradyrhizobium sp. TaxID=376 RepID=UPI003BAFF082
MVRDDRFDYGGPRYRAYGVISGVSHCLVFTVRSERYRPISLRRPHAKEMRRHAPKT